MGKITDERKFLRNPPGLGPLARSMAHRSLGVARGRDEGIGANEGFPSAAEIS